MNPPISPLFFTYSNHIHPSSTPPSLLPSSSVFLLFISNLRPASLLLFASRSLQQTTISSHVFDSSSLSCCVSVQDSAFEGESFRETSLASSASQSSISWLRHQMFYPYIMISDAQARESDDLRHAMSPFSLFLSLVSDTQTILGYVSPRRIVAVHPPKRWKRKPHSEGPSNRNNCWLRPFPVVHFPRCHTFFLFSCSLYLFYPLFCFWLISLCMFLSRLHASTGSDDRRQKTKEIRFCWETAGAFLVSCRCESSQSSPLIGRDLMD